MLKLIGAMLIVLGTASWGAAAAHRLRSRVKSLYALTEAVGVMRNEICLRLTPLHELFDMLSQSAPWPAREFFLNVKAKMEDSPETPMQRTWREAVAQTPSLMLKPQEQLIFSQLGNGLGRYDSGAQNELLGYVRCRLEDCLKAAEKERDANVKVRMFLGVSAGVFAVVILL